MSHYHLNDESAAQRYTTSTTSPPPPHSSLPTTQDKENAERGRFFYEQPPLPAFPSSQQVQQQQRQRRASPTKLISQALRRSPSPTKKQPKIGQAGVISTGNVEADFKRLLDTLEVPGPLRIKLMALDVAVKASMLRGNATLSLSSFGLSPRKSTSALPEKRQASTLDVVGPTDQQSLDVFSGVSIAITSPLLGSSAKVLPSLSALSGGSSSSPAAFATLLRSSPAPALDVARVKRFRAVLGCESPSWVTDFCNAGGYAAMCERLGELLQLEWRQEQHDDLLLHELLRCFVALATTDRGKVALASRAPQPFAQLSTLLWSEKKPGDLSTRRYLVELLLLSAELPLRHLCTCLPPRERSPLLEAPLSHASRTLLVLMHNEYDAATESVVDFVRAGHTPRPFRAWVNEIAGVCRDYFWVFCHSQNRLWHLPDVDVDDVAGPKVPGGMTGGVEFEAIAYLTLQLRLINRVASDLLKSRECNGSLQHAYNYHTHLFSSGFERVVSILRKASQQYYTPMHLELARYLSLADAASFALPANLEVWRALPAPAPSLGEQFALGLVDQTHMSHPPFEDQPQRQDLRRSFVVTNDPYLQQSGVASSVLQAFAPGEALASSSSTNPTAHLATLRLPNPHASPELSTSSSPPSPSPRRGSSNPPLQGVAVNTRTAVASQAQPWEHHLAQKRSTQVNQDTFVSSAVKSWEKLAVAQRKSPTSS